MVELSPDSELDDVFSSVANDTRLDILRALWEIHMESEPDGPEPEPVPFSTIRERVGTRDSGRFNYHLHELVPQLVRSHGDGYTLTYAGTRVIGAAVSGVYTERDATLEKFPISDCPNADCDGRMEAGYEMEHVVVECDSCDVTSTMSAPPILVEAHDPESDPDVLGKFTLTNLQKIVRGFCVLCSGPSEATIDPSPGAYLDATERENERVRIVHECEECGALAHTNAVTLLLDHPAAISLLHDGGVDYREALLWRGTKDVDIVERVIDDDPVRIEVTITAGEEELTALMDGNLDVLEYDRNDR